MFNVLVKRLNIILFGTFVSGTTLNTPHLNFPFLIFNDSAKRIRVQLKLLKKGYASELV